MNRSTRLSSSNSGDSRLPLGSLVNVAALGHLGVGKLHKYDELGRAIMHFAGEGTRILAPRTPMARARLSEATPVRFLAEGGATETGEIVEFLDERSDGGFVYRIRGGDDVHDVWEGNVMPIGETDDPRQLLKTYRWDRAENFFARWAMAETYGRWFSSSGGFPAMLGARVMPLGHQIYAARRVLFDRAPRFILADEVGLGKTIEAGMIVQALQAEASTFNVLVIAPGSMSRQWLTETYLRFGARAYHHVDCARIAAEGARGLARLLAAERLIVATTALEAHPDVGQQLVARHWDMVIVDEAHQVPPDHALYSLLERLSVRTAGLLLLSATPSKRDTAGILGLLRLVAPEAYGAETVERLQRKSDAQHAIWDRLNFTRKFLDAAAAEGRNLDEEELAFAAEEWAGLIEGDQFFDALLARMQAGEVAAAVELIAYVQEFHRLDHRIIRTRRATLGGEATAWPARALVEIEWSPNPAEAMFLQHLSELPVATDEAGCALRALYQRFCTGSAASALRFFALRNAAIEAGPADAPSAPIHHLAGDAGPNDEPLMLSRLVGSLPVLPGEAEWIESALGLAREWAEEGTSSRAAHLCNWLTEHLATPDHQVLVFVQDADAAEELGAILAERLGGGAVAQFHCGLDEQVLAETAFRFQHDQGCRVLVCDELGGEGRNFQNASAVVHFDIPVSCARIEQRIGRLDRVGRASDRVVLSVVTSAAIPADEALLETHHSVFGVFERTIGGLEFVLPRLQAQIVAAYGESASALRALKDELQAAVAAALGAVDEAFDLSLDATKPHLERANGLAAQFDDGDVDATSAAIRSWGSRLGIQARKLPDGSSEFQWSNGSLNVTSGRLAIGAGTDTERRSVNGTFARERALSQENLQYFAPGHDLVDAMIFEAQHGQHSRVTAYALEGFPAHKGTWLLQVLARSRLDERLWQGHDIGPGLAARARAMLWPEVIGEVMLIWNRDGARHDVVTHAGLRSLLDRPRRDLRFAPIDVTRVSGLPYIGSLWSAFDQALPIAVARIEESRRPVAQERATALATSLRAELGYLRWRTETAATSEVAEARAGIAAREAVINSLREAKVDVFGLALVALT